MDHNLLKEVIKRIKSVNVAIIGDFCLDAYFFLDNSKSEISVETGLETNAVISQKYSLGGAGNIANNVISLGVNKVKVFGIIGNDIFGREMVKIMNGAGICTDALIIQDDQWSTHVYVKPYLQEKELNRFDFGNFNIIQDEYADKLIKLLEAEIDKYDVIIINQQVQSGIHSPGLRKRLLEFIRLNPDKIFISDIRDPNFSLPGSYLKLNEIEAFNLCGFNIPDDNLITDDDVKKAAFTLFKKWGKPVFITRGSRGSVAIDKAGFVQIAGLMHLGRIDPVGAGDSYLAGISVTLAASFGIETAANIGSFVAGVTVKKLFQTGTATPEEVLQTGSDPDYLYEIELSNDIRKARYHPNSEIEIINVLPDNLKVKYAIFDHDGTISTLREGWELIMAPMMIKAIMGDKYMTADETIYNKVSDRVREVIDKTTGVRTLVQMSVLIDLIKEFGIVPEKEILDIHGYKRIYNDELIALVRQREKKLINGELNIEDFTLKNAVKVIQYLHNRGIILYLASGTDEDDVRNEAHILGYDHLFKGGIYGASGNINTEAKKVVLEKILKKIDDPDAGKIITFGDGPVEIRETKKRGGITVGIASDEIRRFGLNEKKRTRLIQAGADFIIPDFTQANELFKLLNLI